MTKKMTYLEIGMMLQQASNNCLQKTGSYGTITGTYESLLADIVANLPLHKQEEVKRALNTTASYIEHVYAKSA